MILSDKEFPMNIVDILRDRVNDRLLEGSGAECILRPLTPSDPNFSIGVFPFDWLPEEDSQEIGGGGVPTLQRYFIKIHLMVKSADPEEGRAIYANESKKLRLMLYHDRALGIALSQLREQSSEHVEQFKRARIQRQRFLNNELQGRFIFLSATDIWVETENRNLGGF